jgi:hypothetical protein
MKRADKLVGGIAAPVLLLTLPAPASAQLAGFPGGGVGGQDMMTQMAPMLEMVKAKMGRKRFAALMQAMGPMMSQMMQNGGFGAIGATPGDFDGYGFSAGDVAGMMSMIAPLMQIANVGAGGGHRRHHRRHD